MNRQFRKLLEEAQGRSEQLIAVVCDIRGFSIFSSGGRGVESPAVAMFIKRFYIKLIDSYFPTANFVKPTGDGLLMVFRYSEKTLDLVSKTVIDGCMRCLMDFPEMFKGDPMVNFPTPSLLGFGIARGTACCLYSGKTLLDYSGHLLNLASRLMDLARPSGIVIDGQYMESVIPEEHRSRFKRQAVYIRSIAENSPSDILYLTPEVRINPNALVPLAEEAWELESHSFPVSQLKRLATRFRLRLTKEPVLPTKFKVIFQYPNPKMTGFERLRTLKKCTYLKGADGWFIVVDIPEALDIVKGAKIKAKDSVTFELHYVPKRPTVPKKPTGDLLTPSKQ